MSTTVSEQRAVTGWLTSAQAAEVIGIHPNTLGLWRRSGRGPVFQKLGGRRNSHIRYRASDVYEWMAGRVYTPEQVA